MGWSARRSSNTRGRHKEQLGERDAHLPPTAEGFRRPRLKSLFAEAETVQDALGFGLRGRTARGVSNRSRTS